jgi:hypothetical protein
MPTPKITARKKALKAASKKTSRPAFVREVDPIIWKHSFLTSFGAGGEMTEDSCEVRISNGSIAISYDDVGKVVYEGTEEAPGHFRLSCSAVNGRATLHRFPDDDMLEGFWAEGGYLGMWRIQLNDDAE